MNPFITRPATLAACVLALAFSGCENNRKSGRLPAGGADGDFVNGSPLPDRQEGVSFLGANVDRHKFSPIYFGFDSSGVGGNEHAKIEQVAAFMKSAPNTIIIAGFTDERGTPEYNRALGEKRALSVREAVIRAGGDARRLQTVSFGSEMPADSGSNEGAWAKNRRAEFGVVK